MSPDPRPRTQIRLGAGTRNEIDIGNTFWEAADDLNHNVFAFSRPVPYAADPRRPRGRPRRAAGAPPRARLRSTATRHMAGRRPNNRNAGSERSNRGPSFRGAERRPPSTTRLPLRHGSAMGTSGFRCVRLCRPDVDRVPGWCRVLAVGLVDVRPDTCRKAVPTCRFMLWGARWLEPAPNGLPIHVT
jgi:hypothetical protein